MPSGASFPTHDFPPHESVGMSCPTKPPPSELCCSPLHLLAADTSALSLILDLGLGHLSNAQLVDRRRRWRDRVRGAGHSPVDAVCVRLLLQLRAQGLCQGRLLQPGRRRPLPVGVPPPARLLHDLMDLQLRLRALVNGALLLQRRAQQPAGPRSFKACLSLSKETGPVCSRYQ